MKILLLSDLHYGFSEDTYEILDDFYKSILEQECFDLVVITGDINSHSQNTFRDALIQLRSHIVKQPILIVHGNHDWWDFDNEYENMEQIGKYHDSIFEEFNILNLEDLDSIIFENILFTGFGGWYGHPNHPTNDYRWVPESFKGFKKLINLKNKSIKKLKALSILNNKKIVVTHFGFDKDYGCSGEDERAIFNIADMVLYGHSHKYDISSRGGIPTYNCGGDYDNPKYLIIEV